MASRLDFVQVNACSVRATSTPLGKRRANKKELEERNARIEHLRLVIREDERVLLEESLLGLSTDKTERRLRVSRDLLRLEL